MKVDISVEDREYSAEEVGKNINDIISKSMDIEKTQVEFMSLLNTLQNYLQ